MEQKEGQEFPEFEHRKREMAVPEEMIPTMRKAIMGMYKEKLHVTLDTLLQKLKARIATRQSAWIWFKTSLYNFLTNKMNYTYSEKKSHYESIKEDVVIAEQRIKYIKQLKAYRDEGRAIY